MKKNKRSSDGREPWYVMVVGIPLAIAFVWLFEFATGWKAAETAKDGNLRKTRTMP